MNQRENSPLRRLGAWLLSLLLIMCMIPGGLIASAFADGNTYNVVVRSDGVPSEPIEGASVKIATNTQLTDVSGMATFYTAGFPADVTYLVTKEGYADADGTETVASNSDLVVTLFALPVIQSVTVDPDGWTNQNITLTVNGKNAVSYKMDDGTWQDSNAFTVSANGTYQFYAKNSNGNITAAFGVTVSKIDTVAPTGGTLSYDPAEEWSNEGITVTMVGAADNDGGSGLAENAYKMDDGEWQASSAFTVSDNSAHTFYVRDAAGNTASVAIDVSKVKYDGVAPVVALEGTEQYWNGSAYVDADGTSFYRKAAITATATDLGSGLHTAAPYRLDDGAWQASAVLEITDEAGHTVYVRDIAGNEGSYSQPALAWIDATPPTVTVAASESATGSNYTKNGVTYVATATDIRSGVAICWVDEDIANAQMLADAVDNGDGSYTFTFTGVTGKSHVFHVKDQVENENTATINVNYDGLAPKLVDTAVVGESTVYPINFTVKPGTQTQSLWEKLAAFVGGKHFNKDWEVSVAAEDVPDAENIATGLSGCDMIFRPATGTDIVLSSTTDSDGVYTFDLENTLLDSFQGRIFVVLKDQAGNVSAELQATTGNSNLSDTPFMIENTAPVVSDVTPAENESKYNRDFTFGFKIEDPVQNTLGNDVFCSGLAHVALTVNNKTVLTDDTGVKTTFTDIPVQVASKTVNGVALGDDWNKGKLEFRIEAFDKAGNYVLSDVYTYYIDQTAPVVAFTVDGQDAAVVASNSDLVAYFCDKDSAEVTISASDVPNGVEDAESSSGIQSIVYYTTPIAGVAGTPVVVTGTDLIGGNAVTVTLDSGFRGYIYAYAVDAVGNNPANSDTVYNKVDYDAGYTHPAGIVVNSTNASADHISITAPDSAYVQSAESSAPYAATGTADLNTYTYDPNAVRLYSNVPGGGLVFHVVAEEALFGIRSVKWTVLEDGTATATDTLTVDGSGALSDTANWTKMSGSLNLVEKVATDVSVTGNHNNMVLLVEVTNNADKTTYDYYQFGVDTTKPTVAVSFDGTAFSADCYNQDRTATITVTERNFNPNNVIPVVKKDGSPYVSYTFTADSWTAAGSGDAMTHTRSILFSEDGDYTFDIYCADRGGLTSKEGDTSVVAYTGTDTTAFTLDKTDPQLVTITDLQGDTQKYVDAEDKTWYSGDVKLEIPVSDNFSGIYGTTFDVNGAAVTEQSILDTDGVTAVNGATLPANRYLALTYVLNTSQGAIKADASYTIQAEVTDKAGNTDSKLLTIYKDTMAPVIAEEDYTFSGGNGGNGTEAAVVLTDYGYYFKDETQVKIQATDQNKSGDTDITSVGVKSITVKAIDTNNDVYGLSLAGGSYILTKDAPIIPVDVDTADNSIQFTVNANFKGRIYSYGTDFVGNYPHTVAGTEPTFFTPYGAVVENQAMHTMTSSITILASATDLTQSWDTTLRATETDLPAGSGTVDQVMDTTSAEAALPLYASNPTFKVSVSDQYSGIAKVDWQLYKLTCTSESKTVTAVDGISGNVVIGNSNGSVEYAVGDVIGEGWRVADVGSNLVYQIEREISVNTEGNNLVLFVRLTDRAGNVSHDYYEFGIDKTAPAVLLSFDNNNVDSGSFFKETRRATITVTDGNFDPDKISVETGGQKGSWTSHVDTGDFGKSTYTLTVDYTSDGDYKLNISGYDRAGFANTPVAYAPGTQAPTEFTIDRTAPQVTVTYDNQDARNGNYYRADRVATIIVNEHNFDPSRITINGTANDNGNAVTFPSLSTWNTNGDTNTATISYTADALYTFDITVMDKAGNSAADYTADSFYVDKTQPEITISGVEDGKAYGYDDSVIPSVSITDTNYESYTMQLLQSYFDELGKNVTAQFMPGLNEAEQSATGSFDRFEKEEENDGVYALRVTAVDKAGNESEKELTFFVDRFGSVYVYSRDLVALNHTVDNEGKEIATYNQSAQGDLYITIYNAVPLEHDSAKLQITCDGSTVVGQRSNAVITADTRTQDAGWYAYQIDIIEDDLRADGRYSIMLSDKDTAGNTKTNANHPIWFYVDATKPALDSVVGLEKSAEYADSWDVNFNAGDAIKLDRVEVEVSGMTVISEQELDGNKYEGTFTLDSGSRQKIKISLWDKAGNVFTTDDEDFAPAYDFNNTITVTTNPLIWWYAHPVPFWSSVGVAAGGGSFGLIKLIGKKRILAEMADEQ